MKKHFVFAAAILLYIFAFTSCEDYVTDIDPLIDQVEDEQLNNERQVPFIIVGLLTQFGETHDELMMIADLFSDQLWFTRKVKGMSYGSYEEIDNGILRFDSGSLEGPEVEIGRLRLYGDDLVERIGKISFTDENLKTEALFKGHFFGGIARYYYATYYSLTGTEGGGCIDGGPFIPSNEMYARAIEKLNSSLPYATDYETRVVNSLIARCYLFNNDLANALAYAQIGLAMGDDPFQAEHNAADDPNYYWSQAGIGRTQAVADFRFKDYITAEPEEANRVLLEEILGLDRRTKYYRQFKYPEPGTGVNLISWQENELMLAEIYLKGAGSGDPLAAVNKVRSSHNISPLNSVDMNVLIEERDKELFVTGLRLVDQRRFEADYNTWHLPDTEWRYLPIGEQERNSNENLKGN